MFAYLIRTVTKRVGGEENMRIDGKQVFAQLARKCATHVSSYIWSMGRTTKKWRGESPICRVQVSRWGILTLI